MREVGGPESRKLLHFLLEAARPHTLHRASRRRGPQVRRRLAAAAVRRPALLLSHLTPPEPLFALCGSWAPRPFANICIK
jgi:hypothetical protein